MDRFSYFTGSGPYVDLNGNPVSRTRDKYPYSYEPYVTFKNGNKESITGTAYSDRLFQWDHEKYNKFCREVWGNEAQYFDNRHPSTIERFLRLYFESPRLILIAVMQGANMANGFPYWIFFYSEPITALNPSTCDATDSKL